MRISGMLGTSRPSGVSGNAGFLTARMPAGNKNSGLRGGSRQCARRSNVSLVDSATDWGMIAKRPPNRGRSLRVEQVVVGIGSREGDHERDVGPARHAQGERTRAVGVESMNQ